MVRRLHARWEPVGLGIGRVVEPMAVGDEPAVDVGDPLELDPRLFDRQLHRQRAHPLDLRLDPVGKRQVGGHQHHGRRAVVVNGEPDTAGNLLPSEQHEPARADQPRLRRLRAGTVIFRSFTAI